MSTSTQNSAGLKSRLKLQIERLIGYTEHLKRLQQATAQNDPVLVEELVASNAHKVQALEAAQQDILSLLPGLGFAHTPEGLKQCFSHCNDDELHALGREFEQCAATLKKSIMLNDMAIRKSQQRVRQAIRILTGRIHDASADTYTSQGGQKNAALNNQRILARA